MLFTDTQSIYYAYSSKPYTLCSDYNAQIKFYYEYRPDEQKVYVTNISFTLTKGTGENKIPISDPFGSIANINNWANGIGPWEQGKITFFVNGQQALQFNFNDKKYYYEQSGKNNDYKNIFFLKKDLLLYQDSFNLPSLSDEVTVKFDTMGLYGLDTGYVRRYLRFYNQTSTETPIILPINNTYEIKQEGIVGNTSAANDTNGNIRLLYQIRHYNSGEDIMYDATPFSPVANQDYLFYKLQVGRGDCREVTHSRIGIGVNDSSSFTSNYTVYPTGNTYLKILVNNIDIIQYLRESIYNSTSQSFRDKTNAGKGGSPMYTGKTGSTYETGLTYSGSWYQVFDNLTIDDSFKIIPQGLYPLTPGTTIDITLSCSNIYQHYWYEGGTQSGYYWFSNGGNVCNQFHVPLNPGSNNTATGIFVPTDGCVYIHNGANFEAYIPYIYNETTSTWEQYLPYIYNGTDWELQG